MVANPPIIALDYRDVASARALVEQLPVGACRLKVGKELFVRGGPALVESFVADGWEVFLDLKFHDIPNTVAGACRAAADLGVWMVNVHALGGLAMLEAARAAIDQRPHSPLLTAVTVLTSHDAETLAQTGIEGPPEAAVLRLARLAFEADLDGVVCSAWEADAIRQAFGEDFRRVTPGVRPSGRGDDDQRRVVTPQAAMAGGSTDLVIGRPVTQAADPAAALVAIQNEMQITEGPPTSP